VRLACRSTIEAINETLDGPRPAASASPATRARRDVRAAPEARVAPLPSVTVPKRREWGVHADDYVETLIRLVHEAAWAPRARELRAILGVKKDPFLRIADKALATGRIVRTGYKASVTYLPAEDGKALKVGTTRLAAGARPKSTRPYHKDAEPGEPSAETPEAFSSSTSAQTEAAP